MATTTLHFVFTGSGAACLVQALRKAGRDDQVIAHVEELNLGPIDPADPSQRTKWLEDKFGRETWRYRGKEERVWDEARFPDNKKVAWLTRRCAMEYAGFLAWLTRLGDAPCEVVDLTDVRISVAGNRSHLAMSVGRLHPRIIRAHRLWDLAEPLQLPTRRRYQDLWSQLRSENAPLRVVAGDELVSAPITFFDSRLLAQVNPEWQNVARLISQFVARQGDVLQTDDTFVTTRLYAMVASGLIELRGESVFDTDGSEVRLKYAKH